MKHQRTKISIWSLIVLFIFISTYIPASAKPLFAPNPMVGVNSPDDPFIGEVFTLEVSFSNPGDTGYGPYVNLFLPLSGADGLTPPGPNDGASFVSASFLGGSITSQVLTCPAGGSITHPLTNQTVVCPPQPPGLYAPFEWQLVVFTLPFGSYVAAQPDAVISVDVNLSNFADLNVPLPIYTESGFMYGADPLNNPGVDPAIVGTRGQTTVTPKLITLEKTYNGPEDETATGPNYPRQYTITAEIAQGQTVTNLEVTDSLPDNMQFTRYISISPAANCSWPSTSKPGGDVNCTFAAATGTVVIVFEYYIPLNDLDGVPVIDPVSGDDVLSCNNVSAVGDWNPLDPRDDGAVGNVNENPAACEHQLTDKSIAIQKGVSVVGGGIPAPGKYLEYTLNFQVSDYFAFKDVLVTDVISDGQHFDPSFPPTLLINGNGFTTGPTDIAAANFEVACNYTGAVINGSDCTSLDPAADNGMTTLRFDVSAELISRSFEGKMIGGCVPLTGTGGSEPSCSVYNNGATTGTIVFRTKVLENFVDDYPSGDPSVDQGDVLNDNVTVSGNLLSVDDVDKLTGASEEDTSAASVAIPYGQITKGIYALNGNTSFSSPVRIAPGDTVTYRVSYTLPISRFEDLVITDYLPLPIFNATEITTFTASVCDTPAAGMACYGENDTYHNLAGAVTPTLATSGPLASNSISWTYGNNDDVNRPASVIDLLFTVTVNNQPFADGLFLTNQAQTVEASTNAGANNENNIIQIILTEPVVGITKGVVWTDRVGNPSPLFSPAQVGPNGVTFDGTSACNTRFVGTISSDGLAANPINSNVSNLDAGDTVLMAVVLENTGRYQAFDVQVKDALPSGLSYVPGSLCVSDGFGSSLSYSDLDGGLFGVGLELTDGATTGALARGKDSNDVATADGSNIAIITYLATLDANVEAGGTYTNVSTLTNYAGAENGPDHTYTDPQDDATVTVFTPTVDKNLTATDRDFTSGNSVAIGEIVTYTVTVKVPEGVTKNVVLTDQLDAGLAFVGCDSITASSGVSTNVAGGFSGICSGVSVTYAGNNTSVNQGRSISYDFGTITNNNTNNAVDDTITIVYRAVVLNSLGNNPGTNLNNNAVLTWDGGSDSDSADNVTVVEPFLQVNKTASPATGVDAADTITFSVTVAHTGQSGVNAFDVHIKDDLSALPYTLTSLSLPPTFSGDTCGTPSVTDNSILTGNLIDLVIDQLPLGCSATLTYTATVNVTVTPQQVITNTAYADWTSLPGDNNDDLSGHNNLSCERTGDTSDCGATANDYRANDPADVTIKAAAFTKTLVSTGLVNPSNTLLQAVIGETIDYQVVLTIPEGTTPNLEIRDMLDSGLAFVGCISLAASPGLSTDLYGGFSAACPVPPQSPAVNPTVSANARSIIYKLGNVVNNNTNNAVAETITINYRVVVLNTAANQAGTELNNSARPYSGTTALTPDSSANNVTIIEPTPTVAKAATIGGGSIGLPGQEVVYTITINNPATGSTDAYDLVINDLLPKVDPEADPQDNRSLIVDPEIDSVTGGNVADYQLVGSNAGGWLLENINPLTVPVNHTITIVIKGTLLQVVPPAVSADQLIKNIVDMTWTSLPGNPGQVSTYATDSRERDGSGGVNDYATDSDADIRIENIVFSKELIDFGNPPNVLSGQDVRIGEIIRYRVTFQIPRDVYLNDLTFADTLDDGLAYVTCSAINAESDLVSDLTNAFSCSNGTIAITNNGMNLAIGFGNVKNENLNQSRSIVVEYDVIVLNTSSNQRDGLRNNAVTANFTVNGDSTTLNTNAPDVTINEPDLTIDKQASPTVGDAGDVITFTVTVNSQSGTNYNDAYDVVWEDVIPTGFTYVTGSAAYVSGETLTSGPTYDTGTKTLSAGWGVFPPGSSSVITFQATLDGDVLPNQVINNAVDLYWTSMPGTVDNPSPHTDLDCERTGKSSECGGDANTYHDDDQATVTVNAVEFMKGLTATSADHTTGNNLTIGEVATFSLTITLPEGTIPTLNVTDQIPTGMAYVANSLVFDHTGFGGSYDTPVVTPAANTNGTNGQDLQIVLNNVIVPATTGTVNNVLVIRFNAVVLNVIGNQAGNNLVNSASYQIGTQPAVSSNNVTMPVVEPELTITKSFDATNAPFEAGDTVPYTLVISNTSGLNAFDVDISDYAYATVSNVQTTQSPVNLVNLQDLTSGNHVHFTVGEFPTGTTLTITYDVVLPDTLQVGETVENTATVRWTSLDGTDQNERTGVPSDPVNDYIDEDNQDFTVELPAISKSVDKIEATIGETVRFTLNITSPKGTIEDWVITDTLPAGLIYAGNITQSGFTFPAPVVSTPNDGSAAVTLTWTMTNPSVITNNSMSISFDVVVANVTGNQDGDNRENSVLMGYTDGNVDPQEDEDTADFDIIEPDLLVSKNFNPNPAGLGQTVTYTITLSHSPNSHATAHDIFLDDVIPTGLTYVPDSIGGTCTSGSLTWVDSAEPTLTWKLNQLPLGNSCTLTYQVTVDSDTLSETLTNAVSGGYSTLPDDPDQERDYDLETEVDLIPIGPDFDIEKSDGDIRTEPGGIVVYTIDYSNNGTGTALGVKITETVPEYTTYDTSSNTYSWNCADGSPNPTECVLTIGDLPASATGSVTFAVKVDDVVPAGVTEIYNIAFISDNGSSGIDPKSDDEDTPLDAVPDITVTKTDHVTQVAPGATLTYEIVVSNVGNQDATGVLVVDTIPAGTTFVEADQSGTFNSGTGEVSWPVFNLAAGDSRTFTVKVLVDKPLDPEIVSILNTVTANDDGSNGEDPTPENNEDTDEDAIGNGFKQIVVGDLYGEDNPAPAPGSPLTVRIGDVITYEVSLLIGAGSTLEDLVLTDVLDSGFAFVDCEVEGVGLTEDPAHPFATLCSSSSMLVETEPTGSTNPADPGRKLTLTFGDVSNYSQGDLYLLVRYRVKVLNSAENVRDLLLGNDAEWTWDGGNIPMKAEDVKVVEPDLVVEKSVNPLTAMNGQEVTFTLKIRHTQKSNSYAYDVVLEDKVPGGLIYVPGSLTFVSGQTPTSLSDAAAPTLVAKWDVFEMTEEETILTFRATLSGVGPGQTVSNTATLEWSSLPDTLPVPQSPYNPPLSTERSYVPGSNINVYGSSSSAAINAPELPATGFAPGRVTQLPKMPADFAYAETGGMVLEIPKLGVKINIVGVPLKDGEWDLTWLGKQAGYLEGTTYPTWDGNSGITAHVSNADGTPGPFAALGSLKWGDVVRIYAFGKVYTYSVRETRQIWPTDTSIFKPEKQAWVTLLTCRGYDEASDSYQYRVLSKAVLISVTDQ